MEKSASYRVRKEGKLENLGGEIMLKRQIGKFLVLLVMVSVIFSVLAYANKGEPIVIKYPSMQVGVNSAAPLLKKNLELFDEKYGDEIKVIMEPIPGDKAYLDKMKVLLSANDLPDLIMPGSFNLLDPILEHDPNALVDLTPYLEADPEWRSCFPEEDLEYCSRNGKILSVPEGGQPIGYFYNKELFAKAGIAGPAKTWNEFFEQCEKLKAAGITPLSMDTGDAGWITSLWLCSMIGTSGEAGNKFMNTDKVDNYIIPEFINAAANIQKMFQKYTTADAVGGKYENGASNFFLGRTAMMANGPWMIPDFSKPDMALPGFKDKVGVALYPNDGVFIRPNLGYYVTSKDKEHADATVKFLKFCTNKEAQLRALEMIGRPPAAPGLKIPDTIKQQRPLLSKLVELSGKAKYRYGFAASCWYPNVVDKLSTTYASLAMGLITPEEFAEILTETAKKNK